MKEYMNTVFSKREIIEAILTADYRTYKDPVEAIAARLHTARVEEYNADKRTIEKEIAEKNQFLKTLNNNIVLLNQAYGKALNSWRGETDNE